MILKMRRDREPAPASWVFLPLIVLHPWQQGQRHLLMLLSKKSHSGMLMFRPHREAAEWSSYWLNSDRRSRKRGLEMTANTAASMAVRPHPSMMQLNYSNICCVFKLCVSYSRHTQHLTVQIEGNTAAKNVKLQKYTEFV